MTTLRALRNRAAPGEFRGPQRPSFDLLMYVTSGELRHEVDFRSYTVTPGDLLWVRTGQVQQWGDLSTAEARVVLFVPTLLDATAVTLLRSVGALSHNHFAGAAERGSVIADDLAALLDILDHIDVERSARTTVRHAMLGHVIAVALLRISDSGTAHGHVNAHPSEQLFLAFGQLVEEFYAGRRAVGWYADALGYTSHTVNRAVRLHTGRTAKQFIDARVVLEAQRLLAYERATPVTEIAARLGFDDDANFSKYFAARAGVPPGQFRSQLT